MEQRQVLDFTNILALALPTCDKGVNFASKMGNNADAMDSMLPRAEVARTCGVSLATIRRWHELGDIRAEKRGTCWFYSLEDALARANQGPDDDSTLDPQSALMVQVNAYLKAAHRHVETMHEPGQRLLTMLGEENERLRKRCADLEQKNLEMLATYEKSLMHEHERRLEELAHQAAENRKAEAFRTLIDFAPIVAMGVLEHVAGPGSSGPIEEASLRKLIANLSDEQVAAIASTLPAHGAAILMEIRKRHHGPYKTQAAASPTPANDTT